MENIKHEGNEETLNDMNIITEHQFNIKQWNHILNHLQNQTIDKSTQKHVHPQYKPHTSRSKSTTIRTTKYTHY
jgi:hypothetical protein